MTTADYNTKYCKVFVSCDDLPTLTNKIAELFGRQFNTGS